jgi:hypothetical protein
MLLGFLKNIMLCVKLSLEIVKTVVSCKNFVNIKVKQEGSLAIKMETGNEFSSQTSPTIFSF